MQSLQGWSLESYQQKEYNQKIEFNENSTFNEVIKQLEGKDPIVTQLLMVENNQKFIIQMGDCAELFSECTKEMVDKKIHQINLVLFFIQISNYIQNLLNVQVVKIGRIAGQYAKPRSSPTEMVNDVLTFRGELINSIDSRTPDPGRLIQGYENSLNTMQIYQKVNI